MDRRSWPWKKKHPNKTVATLIDDSTFASSDSATSQPNQDNSKKTKYVQISLESYTHLMDLDNEVKTLNDQVNVLNEKLSVANSETTTQENLVRQHSKVAEDAVSGWEKVEAEALALKHELESLTLSKRTAEDRASNLDDALKECMNQIRNVKEENERKLHETILTKTKQWDKIKFEFEAKIKDLDQEILRSSAENAALSRSLHERSSVLMKIREEKSQAEADIELLKTNIESCEREISSLKYEVHVVSKELEIRNEERNMSMRSAEVVNKQHLEDVKKIAKLEAECQRLRGLVRKKLPGPAALAQMKLEVEHLGRDNGETRIRRSPVKNFNPNLGLIPEFSLDNVQQCQQETKFLTARLLETEEETKMLKEALATRNSELQASRDMFAKAASKLLDFEEQLQVLNQHKSSRKLSIEMTTEGSSSQNASNPSSLTSISEDGIDEERNSIDCVMSLKKEIRVNNKAKKVDNPKNVELMDDFLEMERLACLSTETRIGNIHLEQQPDLVPSEKSTTSNDISAEKAEFEATDSRKTCLQYIEDNVESSISSIQVGTLDQELCSAVSQIHDFVISLGKEARAIQDGSFDGHGLTQGIEEFSDSVNKVLCMKMSLVDFVLGLAHVLAKARELSISMPCYKKIEGEINGSDCIDKVTLLENKVFGSTTDNVDATCKCLLELEELKSEKDNVSMELARHTENLEHTKAQLEETEQLVAELKSQLKSSEKSNSLTETQLKCVAESYKSLETRAHVLENEVNLLQTKLDTVNNELKEEKQNHEDALARCKDLQEQIQRTENCLICALPAAADTNDKSKQEKKIADATEKLAECQETIFLLGRQLKAMSPSVGKTGSSRFIEKYQMNENLMEDGDHFELKNVASPNKMLSKEGCESHSDEFNSGFCPSDTESNLILKSPINLKHPKHQNSNSTSSSSSPSLTPEKNSRSFSRFFSSK